MSAIIIMMMVPIGVQAWDTVTFQSHTEGVSSTNMTKESNNVHYLDLDLSSIDTDVTFMFYVSNGHGDLGRNDDATENFDLSSASSFTSYGHKGSSKTWTLKHSTSKYAKYKITAEWKSVSGDVHYWDIKIEGTEEKSSGGDTPATGDGNFYLISNFYNNNESSDGSINVSDRSMKFKKGEDGNYYFKIPASLYGKFRIYDATANKQYTLTNGNSTFNRGTISNSSGTLVESTSNKTDVYGNYDNSTRPTEGTYTITVNPDTKAYTVTYSNLERVVYVLSKGDNAALDILYDTRETTSSSYDHNYFGNTYFDDGFKVVTNWSANNVSDEEKAPRVMVTGEKCYPYSYLQTLGDGDNKGHHNDGWYDTSNSSTSFCHVGITGAFNVEFNPENGAKNWGRIMLKNGGEGDERYPVVSSLHIIGPAIPGTTTGDTWNYANAVPMTYDTNENCWTATITTTNAQTATNVFRFIDGTTVTKNWGENSAAAADQARIPYTDNTATGHKADVDDPNVVGLVTNGTTAERGGYGDIIFNRPAGTWTVKFYVDATNVGTTYTTVYRYTITGTESTAPDATLSPGTDGGNYDFDNYTTGTPETETLTVTLSNATKYAYAIGDNSSVELVESSTETDGSFTLTYDGTKVTDGFGNEVTGNTVYVKIQGQDASDNKGTTHTYQYTFNVPSTLDFTPKGGLFINSAKITVTGGTAPYTYTVKDASGNVRSTGYFVLDGNVDDDNYRISTPGILTVTDANGNSKTSTDAFDFTYSTSENYKNYNNNATGSKIIQTGGGQGALNVFINKNDDLETLWLYAYNKTLDTKLKNQGVTDQNEIDKQVRLTDAFPGNDMTKAPTITIDGIKYVHFTIPQDNLGEDDKVAIIVSQGNTQAENWWTQTTDAGVEIARTEDPAFIYNVKNVPATTADDSWNYKGANQLYQMAANGSRTIFFTKPDGWTEPIYCHAEDPSKPYCYFVDTNSWGSNLRIWAWDDNNNYTGGSWPGATMTYVGDNGASGDSKRYVYRWEYSGDETGKPNKVKFSNNGSSETGTFNFINGAIYNTSGLVKGNEKPTSDKMVLKEGNIYTFSVPVGSTKLYFYDANGNKTSVETYSSDARNHYTWNGSTLSSTPATYAVDTKEYDDFLTTPPTTTVVTQRYPNGEDYWRAAPGDLSIKLDPTWGGKTFIEENSIVDWAGTAVPKRINPEQMPLTQTIQGLNAGKTYTVQAIVRGLGQNGKSVTLTLEGAKTVEKKLYLRNGSGGSEKVSDLGRQGNEVTKTGRIEYIEPLNLAGMNKHTGTDAAGWAKVEATVKASQAGWLTISLTGDEWFDLSQVTLLEDANTDHGFRTTASTSATDTDLANVDFRDRSWKKNNAYSFFDRGKNRNAVVFADKRTVIAMDKSLLAPECPNRDIDRRHPFNVVATNGASDTNGEASVLYLTDMGYGNDANNPIDYQIGENNSEWGEEYNSTNYRKSGYTFMPTVPFRASKVVMDRPIGKETTNRQTTIMLPFAISQNELQTYYGSALKVWSYASYSTDERKIVFTELEGDLVPNTPYILTGAVNPTSGGTAILDSRNNTSSTAKTIPEVTSTMYATAENHSGFTGTYAFQTITRGDENETRYGFNPSTGKFQIASYNGAALKPFRAYFTLPLPYEAQTSAPAYTVVFDDTITGISDTIQVEVEPTDVYTLGGVRVATKGDLSRLPKGVYIVNGKKVIK